MLWERGQTRRTVTEGVAHLPLHRPLPALTGVYETINFDGALYPKDTTIDGQAIDGFVWSGTGIGYVFVEITTTGNGFTSCDLGNSPATNGYTNAIVSTPAALIFFNRPGPSFAGYVCASTGKAFIPQSVQATAAWRNNMTLTFTGYTANGAAVSQLNATINYGAPTKIDLTGLGPIYSMSFAPSGGQYACSSVGGVDDGREFIIDDFVLRSESHETILDRTIAT